MTRVLVDGGRGHRMLNDPELSALIEQAARNLDTLELLVRKGGGEDSLTLQQLRRRLSELRSAYTVETDALTGQVLKRAVERRVGERRASNR